MCTSIDTRGDGWAPTAGHMLLPRGYENHRIFHLLLEASLEDGHKILGENWIIVLSLSKMAESKMK